ncbi:hypothetical protein EJA19_06445 [Mangrovimonas spongiae]|uniref:Uncharacterized protein n=2 Tax=Mangrovimonas spongiae TaxID=2494697 RepID=A0A428K2W5_9FLAO|nr:hypothetical protein EJA19_06445 [Mangrovimonas spongiae]
MKKNIIIVFVMAITALSCQNKQDPFLIEKQHVGLLTDSTQVKDLKLVFPEDSIAKNSPKDAYFKADYSISIFDKSNNKLLTLTPEKIDDSTATITTIKVVDSKFKTKKGITVNSTFGDIQSNYNISSIQNTLKNVVVFVNDINAFFTIDKKELPSELQFNTSTKIEAIQIPEKAKIKYFMLGW